MSKQKDKGGIPGKKTPQKSLKEKRATRLAKRNDKSKNDHWRAL
jgi:hypothetical protein